LGEEASVEYVEPNIVKLSSSDFHLEESGQDIRGFDVYDVEGDKIGSVEDFYIDREAHVTRFLDVKAGGFLGMGKKHFLIPVEEVTRNVSEEDRVTVNHNRDTVLGSPDFDPQDTMPDLSFQRTVYGHYGRPTPEGSSTTKITREQVAAKKGSSDTKKESDQEGGDGVIATVAKKAGKGAAKGAVKGAAKEVWRK
jgi:sporulation protein YlmC with PRC-barrel domain